MDDRSAKRDTPSRNQPGTPPDAPTDAGSQLLPNGPRGMLFEDMDLRELGRRIAR